METLYCRKLRDEEFSFWSHKTFYGSIWKINNNWKIIGGQNGAVPAVQSSCRPPAGPTIRPTATTTCTAAAPSSACKQSDTSSVPNNIASQNQDKRYFHFLFFCMLVSMLYKSWYTLQAIICWISITIFILIGIFLSVQTVQPLIVIYRRCNSVNYHWGCIQFIGHCLILLDPWCNIHLREEKTYQPPI